MDTYLGDGGYADGRPTFNGAMTFQPWIPLSCVSLPAANIIL